MLDNISLELLSLILERLSPQDHLQLALSCRDLSKVVFPLVRRIIFSSEKDILLWHRYSSLTDITLIDCLPPNANIFHLDTRRLTVFFSTSYREKNLGSLGMNQLFSWISNLKLTYLFCNVRINNNYHPLILTQPALRHLNLEFFIPSDLHLISDQIESMSILLLQTRRKTDFSRFKNLRRISIAGNLTPIICESLRTLPCFYDGLSITLTLLRSVLVGKEEISDLPVETLNLSGYEGPLEIFTSIDRMKQITFPSKVKAGFVEAHFNQPTLQGRISGNIITGLFDRREKYFPISEVIHQLVEREKKLLR